MKKTLTIIAVLFAFSLNAQNLKINKGSSTLSLQGTPLELDSCYGVVEEFNLKGEVTFYTYYDKSEHEAGAQRVGIVEIPYNHKFEVGSDTVSIYWAQDKMKTKLENKGYSIIKD